MLEEAAERSLRTRMFSLSPGTPGRSEQIERAIDVDLRAPACEAS